MATCRVYCGIMSLHVKIHSTDSPEEIAAKIYHDFEVGASCSIFGFCIGTEDLIPKGDLVLKELRRLDEADNTRFVGKKKTRSYKYKQESIGGTIAQKIFTWEKRVVDKEPRITIWRYQ
jgi:hypothetical protein